jgi:hypothetical protein
MESNPYFHKVVGVPPIDEDLQEKLDQFITHGVESTGGKYIEEYELEKTPEEIQLIELATQSVDALVRKYSDGKCISIPIENIHILKKGATEKVTKSGNAGAHSEKLKSILVERQESAAKFCAILLHELVHAKSYSALQMRLSPEAQLLPYRSGVAVLSRDGRKEYLGKLQEGITEYLTKQLSEQMVSSHLDLFKEERQISLDEVKENRKDDVAYLITLAENIQNVFSETYSSKEEVIEEFIKAHFTGQLMKIGRLIERAVGNGALRQDVREIK